MASPEGRSSTSRRSTVPTVRAPVIRMLRLGHPLAPRRCRKPNRPRIRRHPYFAPNESRTCPAASAGQLDGDRPTDYAAARGPVSREGDVAALGSLSVPGLVLRRRSSLCSSQASAWATSRRRAPIAVISSAVGRSPSPPHTTRSLARLAFARVSDRTNSSWRPPLESPHAEHARVVARTDLGSRTVVSRRRGAIILVDAGTEEHRGRGGTVDRVFSDLHGGRVGHRS